MDCLKDKNITLSLENIKNPSYLLEKPKVLITLEQDYDPRITYEVDYPTLLSSNSISFEID